MIRRFRNSGKFVLSEVCYSKQTLLSIYIGYRIMNNTVSGTLTLKMTLTNITTVPN